MAQRRWIKPILIFPEPSSPQHTSPDHHHNPSFSFPAPFPSQNSPWCISQRYRSVVLKRNRPPNRHAVAVPATSGPSPERPYRLHLGRKQQKSEQHSSGKLLATIISPRAPGNKEAEPVSFWQLSLSDKKNVVSSSLESWTLSKDDRAKEFLATEILQGQSFPTSLVSWGRGFSAQIPLS